ncbi:hypothetical protein Q669_20645 [Labrenzia sp. C1B10]|nr:hypothetical protein Q669_20645 [Labrenzia sp. C1B10]ERS03284.1 hypothetical protein Q675_04570 [Labrenzia sp. C1B70]
MSGNVQPQKKRLKNLTPGICAKLQDEMRTACREIAEKHGLCFADDDLHDVNLRVGLSYTIRLGLPMEDGSLFEPDREMFEILAPQYGLDPSDFGKEFDDRGERFRVTGLEPRRPKYPVNAERLSDRRKYKFSSDIIGMLLAKSRERN